MGTVDFGGCWRQRRRAVEFELAAVDEPQDGDAGEELRERTDAIASARPVRLAARRVARPEAAVDEDLVPDLDERDAVHAPFGRRRLEVGIQLGREIGGRGRDRDRGEGEGQDWLHGALLFKGKGRARTRRALASPSSAFLN